MKKYCLIFLVILFAGILSACANADKTEDTEVLKSDDSDSANMIPEENNNSESTAQQSAPAGEFNIKDKPTRDDVRLELVEDLLTRDSGTFRIVNLSDQTIEYGRDCVIEEKKDNGWKKAPVVNKEFDVWADAFGLYGKTTRTFQQNWKELYGSLPAGKYRLGKDYFMNKVKYWVYCEFEITEETGEGDDTTDYFKDFFKFVESMPS